MTREERIEKMKVQKVMKGRVFASDILTKPGIATLINVVTIQEWVHLFEPPAPYFHKLEVHKFY